MSEAYTKGIAFILEGPTEKVFYRTYLSWLAKINHCTFIKEQTDDLGDIAFVWTNEDESQKVLIKFNVVGTVTQLTNSGKWFTNKCAKRDKISWHVYLCYDTDSASEDISKFYQDDWKVLRKELQKKAKKIIDLAASADIEDVMLCDLQGICDYLGIAVPEALHGRKGKAKMKYLYRSCGNTYHEGDKAKDMIEALDFEIIMTKSPIRLDLLQLDLLKLDVNGKPFT